MMVTDLLLDKKFSTLSSLSHNESILFEASLLTSLCDSLCDFFYSEHLYNFRLLKSNPIKEKRMIDRKLARRVIKDILISGEYTLSGIAYYTQTPEDVVYDIITGRNKDPSSILFRKLIKLHRSVRPDLYKNILKKIITDYPDELL